MMRAFDVDRGRTLVAAVVGLAVGLRAMQVVRNFNEQGGYVAIAAGGTIIGLVVTIGLVAGVAAWRLASNPKGTEGPTLLVLDIGMIGGGLVGLVAFGAS